MASALRKELELLSDRAMPGTDRGRIDDWVLRLDRGVTRRANSAWAAGGAAMALPDAVDAVEGWYGGHNARPLFQVFADCEPLGAELDRRGYLSRPGADVLIAPVTGVEVDSNAGSWTIRSSGSSAAVPASLVDDPDRLAEMTTTALDQYFVTVVDRDGHFLGGGMATVDGAWVGIFAMATHPEARRRGVATTVLNELLGRGREEGAERAWLQVLPGNLEARHLYDQFGFIQTHSYDYRHPPD